MLEKLNDSTDSFTHPNLIQDSDHEISIHTQDPFICTNPKRNPFSSSSSFQELPILAKELTRFWKTGTEISDKLVMQTQFNSVFFLNSEENSPKDSLPLASSPSQGHHPSPVDVKTTFDTPLHKSPRTQFDSNKLFDESSQFTPSAIENNQTNNFIEFIKNENDIPLQQIDEDFEISSQPSISSPNKLSKILPQGNNIKSPTLSSPKETSEIIDALFIREEMTASNDEEEEKDFSTQITTETKHGSDFDGMDFSQINSGSDPTELHTQGKNIFFLAELIH